MASGSIAVAPKQFFRDSPFSRVLLSQRREVGHYDFVPYSAIRMCTCDGEKEPKAALSCSALALTEDFRRLREPLEHAV